MVSGTIVAILVLGCIEMSAYYGFAQNLPRLSIDQTLRDELDEERPIGGPEDIVGIFVGSPLQMALLDNLVTFVPKHNQSALCARMATRNGRYKGAFSYKLASGASATYSLEFRSKHSQILRGLRAAEFAVSLWLANSCAEPVKGESMRVAASWSVKPEKAQIHFLINSRRLIARIYDAQLSWPAASHGALFYRRRILRLTNCVLTGHQVADRGR